jgi:cobalt-zinc-cadmium efflux system membrane fusion protein
MNKQQMKVIAIMLAVAIAIAALVLARGGSEESAHAGEEHGEHADRAERAGSERDNAELVPMTEAQVRAAGIAVQAAGPARMDSFIRAPGQVSLNEDRTAHVTPRAAGAVEAVRANLGDRVRKGEVLAVIASADVAAQRGALASAERRLRLARELHASEQSLWEAQVTARQDLLKAEAELQEAGIALQAARQQLQALGGLGGGGSNRLQIRAPFDGVVVEKHISLGEVVGADTRVFTIADLATVWANVVVPARDLDIVRDGTPAVVRSIASEATAPGKVSYVSALVGEESRSAQARVVLDNPKLAWRPGLAVNVDIVTGSSAVPVAVPREAVRTVEGRLVVYARTSEGFLARPVAVGRSDGRLVEITAGLRAGELVATSGSFAIKAEQGKGEGGHGH